MKRYTLRHYHDEPSEMVEDARGEFVRFDDIASPSVAEPGRAKVWPLIYAYVDAQCEHRKSRSISTLGMVERAAAALEAALASPPLHQPQSGWLPIETAPKDGSWVLLADAAYPEEALLIARWRHDVWWGKPTPKGHATIWRTATRWMPLPPAPTESQGGGG